MSIIFGLLLSLASFFGFIGRYYVFVMCGNCGGIWPSGISGSAHPTRGDRYSMSWVCESRDVTRRFISQLQGGRFSLNLRDCILIEAREKHILDSES